MLKHEDNPQAPSQSAASVRVTPEEMAAAVTALQIRKEGQPGTIAIGDAVDELGLDVTPEEVLAEVQAKRTRQVYAEKRLLTTKFLGLSLIAAVLLIGLTAWSVLSGNHGTSASSSVQESSAGFVHITANPNITVGDASGKIMMLSEAQDNQLVYSLLDYSDLVGGHPAKFIGYQSGLASDQLWALIKHGNKVYVRGWMLNASPKVMKTYGADVFTTRISGSYVPVTLPLDGFTITPRKGASGTGNTEFHADAVRQDKYTYEK